jgi:NAD-dependent DNA ligase
VLKLADLSLMKFYIANDLNTMVREQAEELVKMKGGIIRDTISNDLWYFVTNNPKANNKEIQHAKDLGVMLISEPDFLKMLK